MKSIEKMHPILRWILFIPTLFVVTYIVNVISNFGLLRYIGPRESSIITEIIYTIQEIISISIGLSASCYMAPRGRIVISSIYVGIILLLLGGNLVFVITGSISDVAATTIISNVCLLISSLAVLVHQVSVSKRQKHPYLGG